jgi:hypothetical protein
VEPPARGWQGKGGKNEKYISLNIVLLFLPRYF